MARMLEKIIKVEEQCALHEAQLRQQHEEEEARRREELRMLSKHQREEVIKKH